MYNRGPSVVVFDLQMPKGLMLAFVFGHLLQITDL